MTSEVFRTPMGVYVLEHDTTSSRQIEITGRLDNEHYEISMICQYVPAGGVVINAGAFIGDHVESYSRLVGGDGHVYAFEPHPITYTALEANTARLNNVTISSFALGAKARLAQLCDAANRGAAYVLPSNIVMQTGPTTYQVSIVNLDEHLLPILKRCDFIHLDAEGAEISILKGAQTLLKKFNPVLFMEICGAHLQKWGLAPEGVFQYLRTLGYSVHKIADFGIATNELYNVLALPISPIINCA